MRNSDDHTARRGRHRTMSPAQEKHNTSIILSVVCNSILNSHVSSARDAISMTSTTRTRECGGHRNVSLLCYAMNNSSSYSIRLASPHASATLKCRLPIDECFGIGQLGTLTSAFTVQMRILRSSLRNILKLLRHGSFRNLLDYRSEPFLSVLNSRD